MNSKIDRRDFLTKSSMGILGTATGFVDLTSSIASTNPRSSYLELPKIKEYRSLGRTDFKVSDIGCGVILGNLEGILKSLIAAGINFIDSSESGQNQEAIGKSVKEADRKSLFINTKITISEKESAEDIILRIKRFLGKTGLTYLDGMMLWNINSIKATTNKAFLTAFSRLKKEKLVRFSGVSCHGANYIDNPKDSMEDIITASIESDNYDLVMFVYNYVQQQMGENILKLCEQKNVGSLLMKTDPFGGYFLRIINQVNTAKIKNDTIPKDLTTVYEKIIQKQKDAQPFLEKFGYLNDASYKKAAMSFVLSNPLVSSTLITFRNFEDVNAYLNLSGSRLDDEKIAFINSLKQNCGVFYCRHACGKCEASCPHKISINKIMRYNHYFMAQDRKEYAIQKYKELNGSKADKCIKCEGVCEKACPYSVSIQPLLAIAHNNLNPPV